jgi:hypothetical protein
MIFYSILIMKFIPFLNILSHTVGLTHITDVWDRPVWILREIFQSCRTIYYVKGELIAVFNEAPRHEDVWESGDIAPHIPTSYLRTISILDYVESNERMIDEWLYVRDMEGKQSWPGRSTIPALAPKDWGKPRRTLGHTACAPENIRPEHLREYKSTKLP